MGWTGTSHVADAFAERLIRKTDREVRKSGARGRIRTADTAIFSRMLYQLSYPGTGLARPTGPLASGGYRQGAASCPAPLSCVFCHLFVGEIILVGGAVGGLVDRYAIALAEPAQQVAVAAAAAAEGLEFLGAWFAA